MRHEVVLHPTGQSVWCCSFPETGSEPQTSPHDQFIFDLGKERDRLVAELAVLIAERDEVNQDAERYRWLRECGSNWIKCDVDTEISMSQPDNWDWPTTIDAVIDAAMLPAAPKGEE